MGLSKTGLSTLGTSTLVQFIKSAIYIGYLNRCVVLLSDKQCYNYLIRM